MEGGMPAARRAAEHQVRDGQVQRDEGRPPIVKRSEARLHARGLGTKSSCARAWIPSWSRGAFSTRLVSMQSWSTTTRPRQERAWTRSGSQRLAVLESVQQELIDTNNGRRRDIPVNISAFLGEAEPFHLRATRSRA